MILSKCSSSDLPRWRPFFPYSASFATFGPWDRLFCLRLTSVPWSVAVAGVSSAVEVLGGFPASRSDPGIELSVPESTGAAVSRRLESLPLVLVPARANVAFVSVSTCKSHYDFFISRSIILK